MALRGALLLAVLICVILGCGLPDPRPDLAPPTAPEASDTAKIFTFAMPDSPGSTGVQFLGVEVYYRFFPVGDRGEPRLSSHADLTAQGFVRLASDDDRSGEPNAPLIEAAAGAVTLDFGSVSHGEEPFASFLSFQGSDDVALRRGAADVTGRFKRFRCGEFEEGDPDVTAAVSGPLTDNCAQVQLQAYALSYGRTVEPVKVLYSDAIFLGEIVVGFGS